MFLADEFSLCFIGGRDSDCNIRDKKQNFNSLKINWKVLCITNFDPFVTKWTMFSSTIEQYNFSSYSLAVFCTGSKSCTHSLLLMQWVNMMLSVA